MPLDGGPDPRNVVPMGRLDPALEGSAAQDEDTLAWRNVVEMHMAIYTEEQHYFRVLDHIEDRVRAWPAKMQMHDLLSLQQFIERY